jgi:hypothetical protein
MKLITITFALLFSFSLHAESVTTTTTTTTTTEKKEIPSKEDKGKIKATAEKVSIETKKLLRKVGRKSMDETCEFTESKDECEKQKAEHKALTEKEAVEGVPAY